MMRNAILQSIICFFLVSTACTVDDQVAQQSRISDCGGFEDMLVFKEASNYCDAEMLHWTYAEGKLSLTNTRVVLNCCGEHSTEIKQTSTDSYLVSQTDKPENGMRCHCECVFDFEIAAEGIPENIITLKLKRIVENERVDERLVMETQLDLKEAAGSIVIDQSDVGFICP